MKQRVEVVCWKCEECGEVVGDGDGDGVCIWSVLCVLFVEPNKREYSKSLYVLVLE